MRRHQQSAEGTRFGSLGASKSTQVLSKGFAIFNRNQNHQQLTSSDFNTTSSSKQGNPIYIRTLPFLKRKQTEDYSNDRNEALSKGFDFRKKIPQDINTNKDTVVPAAVISPLSGVPNSTDPSKSQIRFYVHNVGGFNAKFQMTSQLDGTGYSKPNSMHNTAKSSAAFGCRSNTPMTEKTQTPLFTPQATLSAYNSTRTDFQRKPVDTVAESNTFNDGAEQRTILPPVYDKFSDTQKHFFENFMQETKPIFRNDIEVISEKQIQDEFEFHFKADISALENPNSSLAFINGFSHNFPFILNLYKESLRLQKEAQAMKDELRRDMEVMTLKAEKEIEEVTKETNARGEKIASEIREDFVNHQASSFASSKEITKLLRDKLSLQAEIQAAMDRIVQLEGQLYGQEIFNLQSADPCFNNLASQNLRQDTQVSSKAQEYTIRDIIH